MSAQIAYRCTAPSHQTVKADVDHLTIHDREWAYCPYDSTAKGHQWERTSDVSPLPFEKRATLTWRR